MKKWIIFLILSLLLVGGVSYVMGVPDGFNYFAPTLDNVDSITMNEDGWVGIASDAERIVFDGTDGNVEVEGLLTVGSTNEVPVLIIGADSYVEPYNNFNNQLNHLLVIRQSTQTASSIPYPTIIYANNQTGGNNNIGQFLWMNEAIASFEKRVAQLIVRTNGGKKDQGIIIFRTFDTSVQNDLTFDHLGTLSVSGDLVIGSEEVNEDYTLTFDGETNDFLMTWMEDENRLDIDKTVQFESGATVQKTLETQAGRIVETDRITSGVTIDETYHHVFVDTDGGVITVGLSVGEDGRTYRIINVGSSGNNVTINPDATDTIRGGATLVLADGEFSTITYETTEKWW